MKIKIVCFFLLLSIQAAQGSENILNEKKQINNLRFTNRAQCAIDSENPTDSIFLFIDSYNAGKLANSIALLTNQDSQVITKKVMTEFRNSVTYLSLYIMKEMMRGNLPILPVLGINSNLNNFKAATLNCDQKVNCADLNSYIQMVWNARGQKTILKTIDNFSSNNFPLHQSKDRIACNYVKKFSSLQGHLHEAIPTVATLMSVAQAQLNEKDYFVDCSNSNNDIDPRFAITQIDWDTEEVTLNNLGFDFWNSLKIYLSWAWRYTNLIHQSSPQFASILKSVSLEESIMLTPNGCKSLTPPKCNNEYLSMNSVREFAKVSMNSFSAYEYVPENLAQETLNKGVRSINDDFLGTRSFETANDWLQNFRKNLIQNRGMLKSKFMSSIGNLGIIKEKVDPQVLNSELLLRIRNGNISNRTSDELYYMCTELRLAGDQQLDFIRSKIDMLSELRNLQNMQWEDRYPVSSLIEYFKKISSQVLPVCDQLEKNKFWEQSNYIVDKSGFYPWAKEVLQIPLPENPDKLQIINQSPNITNAFVTLTNPNLQTASVFCQTEIDCVRLIIKSVIDLYAVSQYADAVIPINQLALSPSIYNPYSDLNVCKIYDPWFMINQAKRILMADLASTAAFGWNFMPIYVDAKINPANVVSFNQLVSKGQIQYDARIEKSKMERSLVADFGPLLGTPCAVSVNSNGLRTFDFYMLSGITVNYCDGKMNNEIVVNKSNEPLPANRKARSICGGCTLNLLGIASSASSTVISTFNPAKLVVYMLRAFTKFFDAHKDKVNIPKVYEVNPVYVAEAYQQNGGKIPQVCVPSLMQGLRCYSNICKAKIREYFEKRFNTTVTKIELEQVEPIAIKQTAWLQSGICQGDIEVAYQCDEGTGNNFKVNPINIRGRSSSCRSVVGN